MGAIMFKYVQLLCVAFFMKNSNCARTAGIAVVEKLKLSSMIAMCMKENQINTQLCYDALVNASIDDITLHYEPPNNVTGFHLYCRNAQKLMIQIDHHVDSSEYGNVENETYVYMLIIEESTGKFMDQLIYFSDEKSINVTVDSLSTKESTTLSYNITVYIISSNATVQGLGTKKFTTLMEDYQPENITDIKLKQVHEYYDEHTHEMFLDLTVGWNPGRDQTCSYKIIIYGQEMDFQEWAVPIENIYEYTFRRLPANEEYSIGVQGLNSHNEQIHSTEHWATFSFLNDFIALAKCQQISDNIFDVNVTWNEQRQRPAYYEIQIKDRNASDDLSSGVYQATVDGNSTSYFFPDIELFGPAFLLNITAFDENARVVFYDHGYIELERMPPSKLLHNLFYVSLAIMVLLIIILFKVWKGKIDLFVSKFAQKRIDDMDIEAVKSMASGTVLELIAELTKDDSMEVEKENLTILEQLGEGAFGLVKKGLIIRNGEKEYVAVKMIKNTSNLEDIKQFHQEIAVMKSVGQHENIVSIVGHCTSDIKYLMLLTEFCDAGNLLDLLRFEFAKQLKFYDTKGKFSSFQIAMDKYPDSLLNFDMSESDKKEISYKNIGCSAIQHKLLVVNQMYDELNNNTNNCNGQMIKGVEMTATNALYLKLNDDTIKSATVIEVSKAEDEVNPGDDFLTSSDLLSFAKQICDGMDFLSRKKVVHRDLAARNILVCANKTVKISDFGLSRNIHRENYYRKTGIGKLPLKWLALESMTHQVYTSQSDVWSFGILLYEIVTLGAVPYSSISVENLLKQLKTGYRMEKPNNCHILLYELMMHCWNSDPESRPKFDELSAKLQHFLSIENKWGERIIDLEAMFNSCMNEMNYMEPLT